jgi:hypothetical protein
MTVTKVEDAAFEDGEQIGQSGAPVVLRRTAGNHASLKTRDHQACNGIVDALIT